MAEDVPDYEYLLPELLEQGNEFFKGGVHLQDGYHEGADFLLHIHLLVVVCQLLVHELFLPAVGLEHPLVGKNVVVMGEHNALLLELAAQVFHVGNLLKIAH